MRDKLFSVLSITLLLVSFICSSCGTLQRVKNGMVQIWEPDAQTGQPSRLLSYGIVINDQSHILTVLNYENYSPDKLIVTDGKTRFQAEVTAIDPRTSATLLATSEKTDFQPVTVGTISSQSALFYWWPDPEKKHISIAPVTADSFSRHSPYFFDLNSEKLLAGYIESGSVVTNQKGEVIGLLGVFLNKLRLKTPPPNYLPDAITIDSAVELLSAGVSNQIWSKGPAISELTIMNGNNINFFGYGFGGLITSEASYEKMTTALSGLINSLGDPLSNNDLPRYYLALEEGQSTNKIDGRLLTVVYPEQIDLFKSNGDFVAKAKWIGIQWDRTSGNPNVLYYGNSAYNVDGGYIINGDLTALNASLADLKLY